MKRFVKVFSVVAVLAAASTSAFASSISGTIGFGGNGSYSNVTGAFVVGSVLPGIGTNGYVNTAPNMGTLSSFTFLNPAVFGSFKTSTIGAGESIFTTTEAGTTLSFKLTGLTASGPGALGPGFNGTGVLSETGYADTAAAFSLSTNSAAGTFVASTTAATIVATPEPSSVILLATGLIGAATLLVRHRRTA